MGVKSLKCIGNRIVVRQDPPEAVTASSIIIPDTAKKKPSKGTVVAVGPGLPTRDGTERIPCQLKPGDRVLYGKWAGSEIVINGEEFIVLLETDCMVYNIEVGEGEGIEAVAYPPGYVRADTV